MIPRDAPDATTIGALAEVVREHLQAGRPLITRVSGHSMWPTIRDGARVTIVALDRAPVLGDVVLADLGTRGLVLHRVIATTARGFSLKGDANPHADGDFVTFAILGRVDAPPSPALALLSRVSGRLSARALRALRPRVERLAERAPWLMRLVATSCRVAVSATREQSLHGGDRRPEVAGR